MYTVYINMYTVYINMLAGHAGTVATAMQQLNQNGGHVFNLPNCIANRRVRSSQCNVRSHLLHNERLRDLTRAPEDWEWSLAIHGHPRLNFTVCQSAVREEQMGADSMWTGGENGCVRVALSCWF